MKPATLKKASYDPSIFDIDNVDDAMRVILTPEAGMTAQRRWDAEAPHLIRLFEKWVKLRSIILDYGCGIGRLAKPLIEKYGCEIIGVDISSNMRALAESCINDYRFMTMPPDMLHLMAANRCDIALAIWTLQHSFAPRLEIDRIKNMLRDGGKLFVVNNVNRVVPTTAGWLDDGIDVRAVLRDYFTELECGQLPDEIALGTFKEATFWAIYQK